AGLRVISVWNTAGGVGKTTIASNLAYALARRGLPTLLIGLSAPDDLPLILGLTVEPNIVNWMVAPSQESLRDAVQKVEKLNVLAGWPDMLSRAATAGGEGATIANLVVAAAYASYAAIVLDVPPTEWAAEAISASNTLLLVARPELADIWRTVDAYRTVAERMAGQHRIPPEGIYLVLNRSRDGSIRPDDFHRACSDALGRTFPPVVVTVREDPRIMDTQNARRIPFLEVEPLARAMNTLVESLFGTVGKETQPQQKKRGLRIRLGRRK
ncbi:MAG TPA: ParA family protein, partial [Planctomycetes bacterium]|nr:ParA family protein [Planctomycetota bacterium]